MPGFAETGRDAQGVEDHPDFRAHYDANSDAAWGVYRPRIDRALETGNVDLVERLMVKAHKEAIRNALVAVRHGEASPLALARLEKHLADLGLVEGHGLPRRPQPGGRCTIH
jgi:hypothetical protein